MFINYQHGQIIIITGRTVETGAAARPGGLGTARSHHVRSSWGTVLGLRSSEREKEREN